MSSRSGILRIPRAPHERPIPRNLESSLLVHYKPYDPSARLPDRFFIEMGLGMKQLAGCMADKKTDEEDQKDDEDEGHEEDEEKDQANEEKDDEDLGDKNDPPVDPNKNGAVSKVNVFGRYNNILRSAESRF